jgi:hypothetical protein
MVSKPLKRFSSFKRKAVLIPFSTRFGFKSYLRNSLKTRLPSKSVSLLKIKYFSFQSTKCFQIRVLGSVFVSNAFDFNLGAKFLSK